MFCCVVTDEIVQIKLGNKTYFKKVLVLSPRFILRLGTGRMTYPEFTDLNIRFAKMFVGVLNGSATTFEITARRNNDRERLLAIHVLQEGLTDEVALFFSSEISCAERKRVCRILGF